MVKQVRFTHRGMNQDITKSKHSPEFYYSANNIRITATDSQSTLSVSNEKGNTLEVTIPDISIDTIDNVINYGNQSLAYTETASGHEIEDSINRGILPKTSDTQKYIGYTTTRTGVILFTSDGKGMDCVWEIKNLFQDDYDMTLLYLRNLNFSINYPIQALFNFENEKIQKVYWVDGLNQLRFLNIKHSIANGDLEELIDINSNTINQVGNFDLSQPTIEDISGGGQHTAGKIQYAYNLYRINSSQTKISPLSEMIALDRGTSLGGGEVNEIVGASPVVKIANIDDEYTHIKLYAIKYTSYNQIPQISLIAEEDVSSSNQFTYFDDGSIISDLSLAEFLFLGSNPAIPLHIDSKDNTLFTANIKELNFDVPIDCRAFSFPASGVPIVYDNVKPLPTNSTIPVGLPYTFEADSYDGIPLDIDAVNINYDLNKFQQDRTTLGGEGKYLKYELTQTPISITSGEDNQYFKDDEVYRIGIQFYNKLGQKSFVKWIADFRAPSGNLQGTGNTLNVELKPEFFTWLNTTTFENPNDKPVGYKIVRADRTIADRSIICQGTLTQMMAQTTNNVTNYDKWNQLPNRREESDNLIKFPITVSRGFTSNINPLNLTQHLKQMNEDSDYGGGNNISEFPNEEIFSGVATSYKRQQSWQYTKLFQMHPPEILLEEGLAFSSGLKLYIKGLCKATKTDLWYKRIQIQTQVDNLSYKEEEITSFMESQDVKFLGLFGPSDSDTLMDQTLINREYGTFLPASNNVLRNIYGKPEITERGQGSVAYNNDSKLKYSNSFQGFLTDRSDDDNEKAITSMNSFGCKTITLAEGNATTELNDRLGLENLHASANIGDNDGLLLAEIRIPKHLLYLGNLYGGNSFEAKKRNTYIEIGEYKNIVDASINIMSPGDTYVNYYKFARVSKTDTQVLDDQTLQHTEIIYHPVETSVDLKNRNDKSLFPWDTDFQPRYDDYHKYNRVYSQQPTLIQNAAEDISFKTVDNFDTRIQASKVKVPGENVDSWTDILENEVMDLDGKFGPINGLVNLNDKLFALQDEGVAAISINPRVQTQANDGIAIELGTGNVLYSYDYLTTKSGAINKWSITATNSGFYYYDALNETWMRYSGEGLQGLGDAYGLHTFFQNNVNYDIIKANNPLLSKGTVSGYNKINNDVYLTVLQGENSFTLCFNEMTNSFVSFYDYKPSMYIVKGFKMITPNPDNNELWEHFKGDYNSFYGTLYDSSITYLVNPPDKDCVFNNIEYKSEMYLNNIDVPTATLNQIKAYNEYQSSALTNLELNSNINRKFRMWRANIPREENTINRIRGHWAYIDLVLKNPDNYKMILHDMHVNYTAYN